MSTARTTKLDPRLSPEANQRLTAAVRASHRSVSQFLLDSDLARAEEALPDRQRFDLDATQWEAFMAALDAPPPDNERLSRLMPETSPFDPVISG